MRSAVASPHVWLAAFLCYAMAPVLVSWPWGFGLLPVLPLLLMPVCRVPHRRMVFQVVLLGAIAAVIYVTDTAWLSSESLLLFCFSVLTLKWQEINSPRAYQVLATLALIPCALSSLQLSAVVAAVYLLVALLVYVLLLQQQFWSTWQAATGLALRVWLFGLPVVVLLFLTVPRIQGPLWDLGVVFGLPIELMIDQEQRLQGASVKLQAGQISRLKQSDQPVLVAEFSNSVPYKSRLYWRGPVYTEFDGLNWHLPEAWDNRSNLLRDAHRDTDTLEALLTHKADRVHYEARISAHGERWMYGLDFPVGRSAETFISADFQVLGIRPLSHEFNYQHTAYLEYQGGVALTDAQQQYYQQLPPHANPRLQAFGQQLQQQWSTPQERIQALRVYLAEGGYQITPLPDIAPSETSLDRFFFDDKEGGVEHFASATAFVLRAAGIPTRVVAGYRGGSLIALTNFVVVRQANAHVWVEAWLPTTGWQRIEPQDFVLPPTAESVKPAPKAPPKPKPVRPEAAAPPASAPSSPSIAKNTETAPAPTESLRWLRSLSQGVEQWVLNFNPDRQLDLLEKSGLRQANWKTLLALSVLSVLVLGVGYALWMLVKPTPRSPRAEAFEKLNKAMAKRGWQCAEQECPHQWLQRLRPLVGALFPVCETVIQQYIYLSYAPLDAHEQAQVLKHLKNDIKRLAGML